MVEREEAARALAMEFGMYEWAWPVVCGADRRKWEDMAALIERTALAHHKQSPCSAGVYADGRTRCIPDKYEGKHADDHRRAVRSILMHVVTQGVPRWVTEPSPAARGGASDG